MNTIILNEGEKLNVTGRGVIFACSLDLPTRQSLKKILQEKQVLMIVFKGKEYKTRIKDLESFQGDFFREGIRPLGINVEILD